MRYSFFIISLALLTACQPSDVRPGLWLRGDVVTQPVSDWGFATDVDEIFIETSPWYAIAHSTTIWSVVVDGDIYIGSYGQEKKRWEQNVLQDPDATLSISGKLYKVVVIPVTDTTLTASLDLAYNNKYDMAEVFGSVTPVWWFYRVSQR